MAEVASFGEWLKQRRKALHRTQGDLARELSIGFGTLRKLESDERRPSKEIAERLAQALDVPPPARAIFVKVARGELALDLLELASDPATAQLHPPRARPRTNLPVQREPLIGRERQVADVVSLLRRPDTGLVTLRGPGGVGKTRLSLQVAADLLPDFADGVFFVDLAPISDPTLVGPTIGRTLHVEQAGVQPFMETLKAFLRDRRLLLVLDNFEHVAIAALLVDELLRAAPHLKVVATSRVVLGAYGEHDVLVPPLEVPDPARPLPHEGLTQYAAIRLFIERAQAAKADFQVTDETAVAEICQRLDGLPLAIELAAARIRLLPPPALLQRLSSVLAVLTGGARSLPERQQALRNTIDWSYHLLLPGEQRLFAHVAVFVGGWTLEAAEAVCTGVDALPGDMFDGVASLVDKSLLRQQEGVDGAPRFTMLETIRAYALERLQGSADASRVRRQHARYYLALAQRADPELEGQQGTAWLARLETEHGNLRAVLNWALAEREATWGLRFASLLGRFWMMRGYSGEGRRWIAALLALGGEVPEAVRAQALYAAGELAWAQNDSAAALPPLEESLRLYRKLGDTYQMAVVLHCLGRARVRLNDPTARACFAESLTWSRQLNDPNRIARALVGLGIATTDLGDSARAAELLEEALALGRRMGYRRTAFVALRELGGIALDRGDMARARDLAEESVALCRELGDKSELSGCLLSLARIERWRGAFAAAERHYRESLALEGEVEEHLGGADALRELGYLALALGRYDEAAAYLTDSLLILRTSDDQLAISRTLAGSAALAARRGQWPQAARLLGAAEALREALDTVVWLPHRRDYADMLAIVRRELDDRVHAEAVAEGRAMSLEQACAYALRSNDAVDERVAP